VTLYYIPQSSRQLAIDNAHNIRENIQGTCGGQSHGASNDARVVDRRRNDDVLDTAATDACPACALHTTTWSIGTL